MSQELSETLEILDIASQEFIISINEFCLTESVPNPLTDIPREKESDKGLKISGSLNDLYLDIARLTHPDKSQGDDFKCELFKEAATAKKNKDPVDLIEVARKLKIKTDSISYDSIEILEEEIKKKELKITSIHKSFPWIHYYASSSEKNGILFRWYECNRCR